MTFRALLCDFDGVVLDTEWPIYETWREVYEQEGQELTLETYVQCVGSDFGTWSPETALESLTGKHYDWDQINPARQKKIEAALEGAEPCPGIRELFSYLHEQGIPIAIVSSSSHRWVDHWVETLGLSPYVQTNVCRGDAPRIKPAPDLFIEGARQLGLPPSDCLVIEDSHNGLLAAQAAGCSPIVAIPNRITQSVDFSLANHIFTNAQELLEKLTAQKTIPALDS